jgi:hypothetical protein
MIAGHPELHGWSLLVMAASETTENARLANVMKG